MTILAEVTDSDFESWVLKSDLPVLVDFGADWCGPCNLLTTVLQDITKEEKISKKIKVLKMDIEGNPEVPSSLGVRSIPTMMIFKNSKIISTKIGAVSKDELMEWIDHTLAM
jgi:thioredoxin 1